MNLLRSIRGQRTAGTVQNDPSNLPPPSYTSVVTRIYPYTLRPVVIGLGLGVFFYGLIFGGTALRNSQDDAGKEKTWEIVTGAMWLTVSGVGFGSFVVAFVHRLSLMSIWRHIALAGAITAIAAQTLHIVAHYTLKSTLISECADDYVGERVYDSNYNITTITQDQANALCQTSWNRGTLRDVFELILALILGTLFILLTTQYYRQLLNPSAVRVRGQPASQPSNSSYAMEAPTIPYGYGEPGVGPAGSGYRPYGSGTGPGSLYEGGGGGYVPPYPGPPPPDSPYAPKTTDAPSKHDESGSDAKGFGLYGQSGGANGSSVALADEMSYEAQEGAWRDAQRRREGRPAGTGGYAPPSGAPPGREETITGYGVGTNEEEDDAWERARREGPTAHLAEGDRERDRGTGGTNAMV